MTHFAKYQSSSNLPQEQAQLRAAINSRILGFDYRSKFKIFGIPLYHISRGGLESPGIAKGIIAIGDIAIGFVSLGGIATGFIALGGISFGPVLRLDCCQSGRLAWAGWHSALVRSAIGVGERWLSGYMLTGS